VDVHLERVELLALGLELGIGRALPGVVADRVEARARRLCDPAFERALHLVHQHRAHRAELALHGLELAHERLEHAVLITLGVGEVVAPHLG
jgi:hypothetical protein